MLVISKRDNDAVYVRENPGFTGERWWAGLGGVQLTGRLCALNMQGPGVQSPEMKGKQSNRLKLLRTGRFFQPSVGCGSKE